MQSYPVSVTTKTLRKAIKKLPSDQPIHDPNKWYITQKQHWLGWLHGYQGSGAYGRRTDVTRDAQYAYNHIVEVKMLLWLAKAVQIDEAIIEDVTLRTEDEKTLMAKSGIVRKSITWDMVAFKLWPDPEIHSQSFLSRIFTRTRNV